MKEFKEVHTMKDIRELDITAITAVITAEPYKFWKSHVVELEDMFCGTCISITFDNDVQLEGVISMITVECFDGEDHDKFSFNWVID